jgi:hypothetical protein
MLLLNKKQDQGDLDGAAPPSSLKQLHYFTASPPRGGPPPSTPDVDRPACISGNLKPFSNSFQHLAYNIIAGMVVLDQV